ncbi:hypothetical protein [Adlercreutzia mucosicola]|uniref:hypothetical protein n=1 Tax=Adlercreutzia mucosicola TaxID=580026 RepID=UPI00214C3FC6|nr:hypothetical protein [Adlercreutzia mucosicola]
MAAAKMRQPQRALFETEDGGGLPHGKCCPHDALGADRLGFTWDFRFCAVTG